MRGLPPHLKRRRKLLHRMIYQRLLPKTPAAKAQYMDKTVQIKGIVVDKGMSRYMTPYVELSENGKGPAPALCVLPYVGVAYWNRSAQLSDFKQGQTVTMSGRVHNITKERVVLKECKAVDL